VLVKGSPLYICSNAALDHTKFSTFAWIIHSTKMLWSGEGIVPGHLKDTYLGRSEAFGLFTSL